MLKGFIVVSVWLSCACGGGGKKESTAPVDPPIDNTAPARTPAAAPAPAPGSAEASLMKLEELAARMCACTDVTCLKAVSDDMTAWSESQGTPPEMTDEQDRKATGIGTRMGRCVMKVMNASSTEPAAP